MWTAALCLLKQQVGGVDGWDRAVYRLQLSFLPRTAPPTPVLHTLGPLGSGGVWNATRIQGFRYFRAEGRTGLVPEQKFLHPLLSSKLLCSTICPQERCPLTLFLPQYEITSGP